MDVLVSLIVALIIIGVAVWLLDFLPMDADFKRLIKGLLILVVVIYLLGLLFGYHSFTPLRFSR